MTEWKIAVEIDKVNSWLSATIVFDASTNVEFIGIYNKEKAKAALKNEKRLWKLPKL